MSSPDLGFSVMEVVTLCLIGFMGLCGVAVFAALVWFL